MHNSDRLQSDNCFYIIIILSSVLRVAVIQPEMYALFLLGKFND